MREISSLAEVATASWTPSTDSMRIPEVRHNLRLLADAAKSDLDGLTKEAKALEERRKSIPIEDDKLRRKIQEEAECKLICFLPIIILNLFLSNFAASESTHYR